MRMMKQILLRLRFPSTRWKVWAQVGLLLPCVGLVQSCGVHEDSDLKEYSREVLSRNGTPIDPIPTVKVQEAFLYDHQTKRSPFKPLASNANAAFHPDFDRPKEPLEAFSIDSLSLVGNLEKNKTIWAIIAAPDGTVHYITTGGHLGQNFGKVASIQKDKLDVVEMVSNGEGAWEEHPISLTMEQKT